MNNMRRGFTMIELIFVIVIIGILAAVAIPKLAATRDDAQNAKDCANIATCVTDLAAGYTAAGSGGLTAAEAGTACTAASTYLTIGTSDVEVDSVPGGCNYAVGIVTFGGSQVSL